MSILICSGPLLSNWTNILEENVLKASRFLPAYRELTALSINICDRHTRTEDELSWKSFSPDKSFLDTAGRLFSTIENEPLFAWADHHSSLFLDFWRSVNKDIRFILFYTSPEHELAHYLESNSFDKSSADRVISAWYERSRAMLTFFLNNRKASLLVDVHAAASSTGSLLQTVNNQFNIGLAEQTEQVVQHPMPSPIVEYLAVTLLLGRHEISELYDEIRSAATLLGGQDNSIAGPERRSELLIGPFLGELASIEKIGKEKAELEHMISLTELKFGQVTEELDLYFKKSHDLERATAIMADYLDDDPLLRIARKVRQSP